MATLADSGIEARSTGLAQAVDRWIYVFMAGLFLVTVLAGFIPVSLLKIEAVRLGQRPPFPMILHVHAVLMGCWMLLLMTQTTLMATGRRGLHQRLGVIAMVLAPALVIVGFLLVPVVRLQVADAILNGPPEVAAQLRPRFEHQLNIMMVQIRIGVLFAVLTAWGIAVRRRDSGLHKRLMILGTAAALPPATDRMFWLPTSLPESPLTVDLWPLLLIAPMFLWDLYRLRRVHMAYVIALGLGLATTIPMHLLWGTPGWRGTALWLLGVSGV
ncbi:hypothetical protein OK349_06630 [Sphingomonas sp. BT-65]|uniref:hypothetical protein n=1 Tax=Sphingomonas sp. BT-65 TaxID=2989821 RepID=UPI0022358936|nr:hypothetical protein [Sphingomonas sp. BT-65]MCW4461377.1 hypothetical protein [Sphingomonas sp. BT-65]